MRSKIDDVRVANRLVHVVRHAAAHLLKRFRHERGRAAKRDVRAEFRQRPDVRARDAAVKNVAENRHVQPGDFSFFLADRERVEQRLRGMLVRAVAGVDDVRVQHARKKMRRAARAVADDDEIGVERFEVQRGVLERLAFFERRRLGGKIHDVGGQAAAPPVQN